jgi:hypothetical protein
MKSAYELAMERLNKQAPTVKLTAAQKERLAELDSVYAARIAQKEIEIRSDIARAAEAGEAETASDLQDRLVVERRKLQEQLEEKKERVRQGRD